MKLRILSDLHLEFRTSYIPEVIEWLDLSRDNPDLVIIAGDVTPINTKSLAIWRSLCRSSSAPILFVLGNHEYYQSSPYYVEKELRIIEAELPKLKILKKDRSIDYQGFKFIGDTMWFPKNRMTESGKAGMNDFSVIKEFTPWVFEEHEATMRSLAYELSVDPSKTVVVTHNMPSFDLINPCYAGNSLNCYFAVDCTELLETKPALWVYGHTHAVSDRVIHDTRCICNALGYPDELSTSRFHRFLFVQI